MFSNKSTHMLGNILLTLSIFTYIALASLELKGSPGGDYGVGYAFVFLISGASFIICSGLLTWNMAHHHLFDGILISLPKYKNWIIFLAWMAFCASLFVSPELHRFGDKREMLFILKWFTKSKVHLWLPIIVFGCSFFLINFQNKTMPIHTWIKIPMQFGFITSLVFGSSILFEAGKQYIPSKIEQIAARISWIGQSKKEREEEYQKATEFIQNYNEPTIDNLIKYTLSYDEKLQSIATAKIKSFPNHEEDMMAILMNKNLENAYVYDDHTQYVYAYLESNKVHHQKEFLKPIIASIEASARRTVRDLEDPYSWEMGLLNLEIVCKVLEGQFKPYAYEFRPCMLDLQKKLSVDVPNRINDRIRPHYNKQLKKYRKAVNEWLRNN